MEETVRNKQCLELWPAGGMPGKMPEEPEHLYNPGVDDVIRVTGIQAPAMYIFPAENAETPAPLMIVCPGGGYSYMAWNLEGSEIAAFLNANGVSAAVLKYRCPDDREGAFMDVQRAVRQARAHAAEWGIDPNRIGVMGFSAGGHLSARAATGYNHRGYFPQDEIDRFSPVPNVAVLVYPAYLNDEECGDPDHVIAPELAPFQKVPPMLILHNEDDPRYVKGSKVMIAELKAAGFDVQSKLWGEGGHGYGLRSQKEVKAWPQEMLRWSREKGFLK